jgi:hypothetical protein
MLHGAQKFLESLAAQRAPVLLLPKHHGIIKIEDNPAIGSPKQPKLEFAKSNCLEKNNDVVPARFFENLQPFAETGPARRHYRRFDGEPTVVVEAVSQAQTSAWRIAMLNDAENFHFA